MRSGSLALAAWSAVMLGVAATMMVGCGGKAPPAAVQAPTSVAVESPVESAEVLGDPAAPIAGRVLSAVIRTQDVEELRYYVLRTLTDRYAASNGIVVTDAEKAAYAAHIREALSSDPAVAAELGEETAEDGVVRLQAAEAFIKQWKVNRALYQQYGGRIIFQQGGPEPLDAYRDFLEERQAAGDFTIADESMAATFWRYYRDDSMHSFFEPGSAEEGKAFGVEPWLSGA